MLLLCSVRPKPDSVLEDKNLLSFFSQNNFQNVFIFYLVFLLLEESFESLEIEQILKNLSYLAATLILGALSRLEKYPILGVTRFLPLKCTFGKWQYRPSRFRFWYCTQIKTVFSVVHYFCVISISPTHSLSTYIPIYINLVALTCRVALFQFIRL